MIFNKFINYLVCVFLGLTLTACSGGSSGGGGNNATSVVQCATGALCPPAQVNAVPPKTN